MADQEDLLEQVFDLVGAVTDKAGNASVMRDQVTGQGFEDDVGLAAPLDLAAGGNAFGIGE